MNRNKEYRLKRKNQRKDYIIQDKNVNIKSLYYQNETKKEKIDTLKEQIKGIQEERDYLFNKSSIENKYLSQENQKYKEVIDNLKTNIENDIDGFRTINEYGESQAILELLDTYLDILKEAE